MSGMLDIKMLATLKPISSLSPVWLRELLDSSRLEAVPQGQDPFGQQGLQGQSVYLLQGELELEYEDGNRVLVRANSEWARHPLGKRQPEVVRARAMSDLQLLRIDDDLLDMIVTWDQFAPPDGARQATEGATAQDASASVARLLNSGIFGADYLKNGPLAHLPPANIGQLFERIEAVAVRAGDVIIREGDEGDYYYLIGSGRAQVNRMVGGVNMLLAELKPGDVFGEEALVSGARRNATVTMKSSGVLLRLKRQDFSELMQEPLLHRLSFEDAKKKVEQGAVWVDARHPSEYRYDKIPGAINIPLNDVRSAIGVLGRNNTYIAYCQSGRRSSAVAFILAQAGYDVYVLEGGLWKSPRAQRELLAEGGN